MSVESLKDKMRDFKEGKLEKVSLSSSDFSAQGGNPDTPAGSAGGVSGTVEANVPKEAKDDIFTGADGTSDMHAGMTPSFLTETIDITDEDREAFLEAIVTGGRYERTFSIFGGRITGVFRCRKIAESDGIISWLSHCVNAKKLDARIEYMTTMRNALLATQVKSLRGAISEDFPELPTPYGPTRSEDGKEVNDPAWLGLAKSWGDRPEALVTAIHAELQKFEKRYWTMVMESGNQNFWNPAASI